MSERGSNLLIHDILDSGNKILIYTKGLSFNDFISDNKTVDAVIWNFQIMGEAAGRLSAEFKRTYPDIPWRRIRGFLNRIVHEYFGIDYDIVWRILTESLPDIIGSLKGL